MDADPDRSAVYMQCSGVYTARTLQVKHVAAVYTAHAVYYTLQTALQLRCRGTLHVHFRLCSVVAVYTAQSIQSMYSLHCSYPAATLHVHPTSVWGKVINKRMDSFYLECEGPSPEGLFCTLLEIIFIVWQRFCEPCQTKN